MWPMKVAMPYQTSDTVLIDRIHNAPSVGDGQRANAGPDDWSGRKGRGQNCGAFARAVCRVSLSSYL